MGLFNAIILFLFHYCMLDLEREDAASVCFHIFLEQEYYLLNLIKITEIDCNAAKTDSHFEPY